MISYVMEKLGWEADRFHVYRLTQEYPLIPTALVMRHELPDAPA